jgi:hypothetical protein
VSATASPFSRDRIGVQTLSGEGSPSSGSTRWLEVDVAPDHATAVVERLRGLIAQIPDHPSLVPVIDAGVRNGRVFIVTPSVTGESLDSALAVYGPAAFGDALPRLQQVADALDRAAASGLWHGALTPRHIIVAAEDTHLLEVGVAQALLRGGERIRPARQYAAPEVLGGETASPAADQYSLAAIAHEWLFGQAVGPGESVVTVPHLPGVNTDALSTAFTVALSPHPQVRFASCTAFVDALGKATRVDVDPLPPRPVEFARPATIEIAPLPTIELFEPEDEPVLHGVPMAFSALNASPPAAGFGRSALAAALVTGIAIGAAAMWMWMPVRERVVADAGTQEFIDERGNAAAVAPSRSTPVPEPPATPSADDVAPVAREATASLLVRSTPAGATVSIDGVARGVTPLPLRDLEFGDHVVIVSRPGYVAAERQVTLTSDRPARSIELSLAAERVARAAAPAGPAGVATAGSLVVESRPAGATVVVDGRSVGVTPLTITPMTPGRHSVRLERAGYRAWMTTIDVQAGARARVAASMVGGQEEE